MTANNIETSGGRNQLQQASRSANHQYSQVSTAKPGNAAAPSRLGTSQSEGMSPDRFVLKLAEK